MQPKADPVSISRHQGTLALPDPRPKLDALVDPQHPLVLLAISINWSAFEPRWSRCFSLVCGPAANSSRLAAGLFLLKHLESLTDKRLITLWASQPHYQYFCGEIYLQDRVPISTSTLSRWRKQLGEEGLSDLYQCLLPRS